MKKTKLYSLLFLILISLSLVGCINNYRDKNTSTISDTNTSSVKENLNNKKPDITEIEILGMGDMIFHQPIVKNYRTESGYDFTPIFSNISEDIKEADLSIANFEGSINSNRSLNGFPLFNFPRESVMSLKRVGFDALSTANNHCLDTGTDGINETLDTMKEFEIDSFGTNKKNTFNGKILNVKGVKVGLISFTDTLNGMDSLINGKEFMVNTFSDNFMKDIKKLKENSDIVIVYPHWGVEYNHISNERQKELKNQLIESGADIILGSHPHVLQNAEDFEVNGARKFVIYSMGNALSNQRQEFVHHEGVETGCMVKINISKNNDTGKTEIKNINMIPTYVNRYWESGKLVYNIVKLEDYKDGGKFTNTVDDKTREFYINKLNMANGVLKGGANV